MAKLPASVSHVVAQMDPTSRSAFFHEYQAKTKKLSVAYILWFFVGMHYIYFRKVGMQIAFWLSWLVIVGEIWWVVDFFRMPSLRRQYNETIAREVLQTLQIGASFRNADSYQQPHPGQAGAGFPPAVGRPTEPGA